MTVRLSFVFALTLVLSACGFHLAGTRPIAAPLQKVFIDATEKYQGTEPPVESALRALLKRRGAELLADADPAGVTLRLWGISETRQVLTIGADGKAIEYQLTVTVRYSVARANLVLVPPDEVTMTRSYTYNPQTALAEELKEDRLREYLQTELAELLMLRLESKLNATPTTPTP